MLQFTSKAACFSYAVFSAAVHLMSKLPARALYGVKIFFFKPAIFIEKNCPFQHLTCTREFLLCFAFQDDVWMPKCVRLGWFLPYTPADNEYGAWKRHYVACIHTLDSMAGSKRVSGFTSVFAECVDFCVCVSVCMCVCV